MDDNDNKEKLPSMSLGDHLDELRARLMLAIIGIVIGAAISLGFGKHLLEFLRAPYDGVVEAMEISLELQTLKPGEGLIMFIKTCVFFGLLISSPWVFWQIWSFISSGLYKKEKKYIHAVVPASALLFISGAVFFMLIVAPLAMRVFIEFDQSIDVTSNWTLQYYINMVFALTLIFGVAFQMPIVILFAEKMGLVTIQSLAKSRKFVILGITIISAMATPPDPVTLLTLAVPLYFLFEGSLLVCRILKKRKQ